MRTITVFLVVSCLFFHQYSLAGAWNLKKGEAYTQFSFTYLNYSSLLNGNDKNINLYRDIGDYTFQVYNEYGLSDKFDLILNLPYKLVSSSNTLNDQVDFFQDTLTANKLSNLSNVNLGIKYTFIDKQYVLSAQVDVFNKTHVYDDASGLQIGYDAFLFYPSLLYGKGWDRYYIQVQSGLFLNTGKYSQNFLGNFEVGKKIRNGKNYLIFRVDAKLPITTGTSNERNSVQTGLFRDNSSFISPGFKWIQCLPRDFYLNFAIYGAVYSKNEGAQATFNVGLAKSW